MTSQRQEYVYYQTNTDGYEIWHDRISQKAVSIHQLLAISEGEDPGKVFSNGEFQIHHKNGIKWDNRGSNLELLTAKEHGKIHADMRDYQPPSQETKLTKELMKALHVEQGMSYDEIAKKTNHSKGRVRHWIKEYGLRWDQRWK